MTVSSEEWSLLGLLGIEVGPFQEVEVVFLEFELELMGDAVPDFREAVFDPFGRIAAVCGDSQDSGGAS